jgi:hypothetical protein
MILSHWLVGGCWGTPPGDLDDFPACTLAALGALQIIPKKKKSTSHSQDFAQILVINKQKSKAK